jgi:hypothetical protein
MRVVLPSITFDRNIFRPDKYLASYAQRAHRKARSSSCNVSVIVVRL